MGMLTLLMNFMYERSNPSDQDFTNLPNPFTPDFARMVFVSIFLNMLLWPAMLAYLIWRMIR
jgi:hypothetical protein